MRNAISGLLIVAILLMPFPVFAAATPHDIHVQVGEELVQFPDARPFLDNNERVQVPVRFLSEDLGYEVDWVKVDQDFQVTLTKDADVITFQTGSDVALVNGVPESIGTSPLFYDERVYAPLRFISEQGGLAVTWNNENALAMLHQPDEQVAPAFSAPKWKVYNDVRATAYTAPKNKNGEYEARDYMGNIVKLGTVAVDPDVIPLGSTLYIEGYDFNGLPAGGMHAKATDIGGAVKGNKIDIFVPVSRTEALKFGFQDVKVYVLQQ